MLFGDGHTCHIEGIGTIHIKLSDRVIRECEVCTSLEEECDLDQSFGGTGPERDS